MIKVPKNLYTDEQPNTAARWLYHRLIVTYVKEICENKEFSSSLVLLEDYYWIYVKNTT